MIRENLIRDVLPLTHRPHRLPLLPVVEKESGILQHQGRLHHLLQVIICKQGQLGCQVPAKEKSMKESKGGSVLVHLWVELVGSSSLHSSSPAINLSVSSGTNSTSKSPPEIELISVGHTNTAI